MTRKRRTANRSPSRSRQTVTAGASDSTTPPVGSHDSDDHDTDSSSPAKDPPNLVDLSSSSSPVVAVVDKAALKAKTLEGKHHLPVLPLNADKLRELQKKEMEKGRDVARSLWQFRRLYLALGILLGAFLTPLFATSLRPHLDPLLPPAFQRFSDFVALSLNDVELSSVLPNLTLDFMGNVSSMFSTPSFTGLKWGNGDNSVAENEDFVPGARLAAEEGLQAKHPVILIPGIVSTGLEVWNTPPPCAIPNATSSSSTSNATTCENDEVSSRNRACGQKYFRKRMWGTMNQFRAVLLDRDCWMNHMKLEKESGLDPPGVKLRAAQGLDAADYLFPGYWVWARVISNLAALGYDSNNMHLAAYDWRLTFGNLEKRDFFLTKLKTTIELAYNAAGGGDDAPSVVITHSMGSLVFMYFLGWVEQPDVGGVGWAEKYLAGWVNIGGPMLGLPKTIASMVSGEMRDTAQLNAFGAYILEHFFSRNERAELFRSWGGIPSMFLYGGDGVWGRSGELAPDEKPLKPASPPPKTSLPETDSTPSPNPDTNDATHTITPSLSHVLSISLVNSTAKTPLLNLTSDTLMPWMRDLVGQTHWKEKYMFEPARSQAELERNRKVERAWVNPLAVPLPKFNDKFKIWCMYGTGLRTERKYFYTAEPTSRRSDGGPNENATTSTTDGDPKPKYTHVIDVTVQDPERDIENGVQMTDGDATVPLISLGYMCADGWRQKRYNPSMAPVVTREHQDRK
ncbi:hypothetical protein HK104_001068, partial [Borealophlyctis nickersoniae]